MKKAGGSLLPSNVSALAAIWALPAHGKIQALFHPTVIGRKKGRVKPIKSLSRGLTCFGFWYPRGMKFPPTRSLKKV